MPTDATETTFEAITTQEAADAYAAAHVPEEYTTLATRVPELETALADTQRSLLATQVAAETGVPAAALTGATREELEASAQALVEWRGASQPAKVSAPVRQPGLRSGASGTQEPRSPKAAAADALRRLRRSA